MLAPAGCKKADVYRMDGLEKFVETLKVAPDKETYYEIEYQSGAFSSRTVLDIGRNNCYIYNTDTDRNDVLIRSDGEKTHFYIYNLAGRLLREEDGTLTDYCSFERYDFSDYLNTDEYSVARGKEKFNDIEYEYEKYTDKNNVTTTFYYSVSSGKLRHVIGTDFSCYVIGYSDNALETLF